MPFSTRTMTDADWPKLRHFTRGEFVNPDFMGYEFMQWLDEVRAFAGVPMHPSSGFRPPEHNTRVGGAKQSTHMLSPCNAVDLKPMSAAHRFRVVMAAFALGCRRFGIYENGSLHLDRAEDTHPRDVIWVKV